jgi:hypothetical protein
LPHVALREHPVAEADATQQERVTGAIDELAVPGCDVAGELCRAPFEAGAIGRCQ